MDDKTWIGTWNRVDAAPLFPYTLKISPMTEEQLVPIEFTMGGLLLQTCPWIGTVCQDRQSNRYSGTLTMAMSSGGHVQSKVILLFHSSKQLLTLRVERKSSSTLEYDDYDFQKSQ